MIRASREDHEFLRQRLSYEDGAARQIRQLRWLAVMDVVQIPRTDVGTEREGISSVLGCSEQDQPVREHGGRHCEHVAKEARIGFRHEADVVETREASGSMDCDVPRSTTGAFRFEMPPKFSRRFATCRVIELYPKIRSAALSSTRSCWSVWIIIKTNPAAPFCLIDRGVRPVDSLDPPLHSRFWRESPYPG